MGNDRELSMFLFPSMPAEDRRIMLDLGELLALTEGHYRDQLATSIRLLHDAARAEGIVQERRKRSRARCRVIPFRRRF